MTNGFTRSSITVILEDVVYVVSKTLVLSEHVCWEKWLVRIID